MRKFNPEGYLLWEKILPATTPGQLEAGISGIFGLTVQSHGEVTVSGGFGATIDFGAGPVSTKGETDAYFVTLSP